MYRGGGGGDQDFEFHPLLGRGGGGLISISLDQGQYNSIYEGPVCYFKGGSGSPGPGSALAHNQYYDKKSMNASDTIKIRYDFPNKGQTSEVMFKSTST